MIVRKKALTMILLIFLAAALFSSLIRIEPVSASGEEIANGGFEQGDGWTGWINNYAVINSTFRHSGVNSSEVNYSNNFGQTFSPEIQSNLTTSLVFWAARGQDTGTIYPLYVEWTWNTTYSGNLNYNFEIDENNCSVMYQWYQFDVTDLFLAESHDRFLSQIYFSAGSGGFTKWNVDDCSLTTSPSGVTVHGGVDPAAIPPIPSCQVSINGSWDWTPFAASVPAGFKAITLESGSVTRTVNSSYIYGFDHWELTNTSGTFNMGSALSFNAYITEETTVTLFYTTIHISVTSSTPAVSAHFSSEFYGSNYAVPKSFDWNKGSHTFTCLTPSYSPNSSYIYTFDYWLLNGSTHIESLSTGSLSITADTNLTMVYAGSLINPPFPFIYRSGALNTTLYERSDDWTVHATLGYRLDTVNTHTPAFDEKLSATTQNVSYGVRVWAVDYFGNYIELTSGSPAAVVTKGTAGGEMLIGYWTSPTYNSMIDSIHVRLYQRFDAGSWSLSRYFITKAGLYWRLPVSSWAFHYYAIRTVGSTNSTFGHGSYDTYNSRIDLQYYKASPWDIALARLWERNIVGFIFTPWTYWLGDLFWTIMLLGCVTMGYMRSGSFKMVLAVLWILGGSGSILWALIPATALHIAVLMLALAMAITLFRIVSR